jgi:GNAT superfamily N-acetyltransferase
MGVVIPAIGKERLGEYASIPIVCDVRSILGVEEIAGGLGGLAFTERAVRPYRKDYDACADGGPLRWPSRFDISQWGLFLACEGDEVVGGAAVAWNAQGVCMLEGRSDLAVLWDIRVRAQSQRQRVGTALFAHAASWALSKGCAYLKIETQNVNVAACRFYARMGCFLGGIDRLAYRSCPQVADEVMLLWYLDLGKR